MTRKTFETRILQLWMTSRVPLTRPNLQFYTGLDRAKLERRLDELVGDGILEVDSDDAGELIWTVTGAARPAGGATHIADVVKLDRLKGEVAPSRALIKRGVAATALAGLSSGHRDGKSLVAAGALSFFFGPLGWLYAAPLKDALPAVFIYMIAFLLLPHALLAPLLGLFLPLSAAAGVYYAWRHNQRLDRDASADPARRTLPPRR